MREDESKEERIKGLKDIVFSSHDDKGVYSAMMELAHLLSNHEVELQIDKTVEEVAAAFAIGYLAAYAADSNKVRDDVRRKLNVLMRDESSIVAGLKRELSHYRSYKPN